MKDEIVLYQPDSTIQLEVRLQDETVWLNRKHNAMVQTKNSSVVANFATPYKHGSHKGQVQIQQVEYYNLDVIFEARVLLEKIINQAGHLMKQ